MNYRALALVVTTLVGLFSAGCSSSGTGGTGQTQSHQGTVMIENR